MTITAGKMGAAPGTARASGKITREFRVDIHAADGFPRWNYGAYRLDVDHLPSVQGEFRLMESHFTLQNAATRSTNQNDAIVPMA